MKKSCRRSSSHHPFFSSAAASACNGSLLLFLSISALFRPSAALVHLRGRSFSFTFIDAPARFAVPVDESGLCGSLHVAGPIHACSPLHNKGSNETGGGSRFVLIERGVCSFERKVRNAQEEGFAAAIVYDDHDKGSLYSMIGESSGIHIHAMFISKMAGETLKKFAQGQEEECCLNTPIDGTMGSLLVVSFISFVVIVSIVATILFVRNCWLLRRHANGRPPSMNRQAVEVLPWFSFRAAYVNNKQVAETCSICLEEYKDGEKLRVLPCLHEFHTACVDLWLTKWGTFCPVCRHDMNSTR